MAGERTPLVTTDGQRANAPKRNVKKLLVAKIAAGVALAGALGAVYYASSGHGSEVVVSSPVSALSFGVSAITEDNWFCGEQGVEIDYIKLPHKRDDKYFYWFARSRSDTPDADPLLIWLNGGPGASSLEGLLTENGPCLVQPDLTTKRNEWAWNNNANVIWLEQPSGVGFSYVGDDTDRDATGEDVGKNMYAFLEGFLDKHPEFEGRDFYLTGESYCGHYIPAASYYIWQKNKRIEERGGKKRINLQGVAIGNPDPNIPFQYQYMVEMATNNAYNLTLLNETQIAQMKKDAVECGEALKTCKPHSDAPDGCYPVASTCGDKLATPFFAAGHNRYDIRQKCSSAEECTDTDGGVVEKFLASDPVRKALYPVVGKMERGSTGTYVNHAFLDSGDWAKSYMPEITELLNDGLRMLIYAGDADLVCNWFSNRAWTLEVDWKGKQGFNAASETEFKVPEHVGTVRQYENLAFVRVFNAGHLVPKDQPHASWVMLDKFLKNEKL